MSVPTPAINQVRTQPKVDTCLQVFGKPCQTALALLTLDQFSGQHINKIFLLIDPARPKMEDTPLQLLAGLLSNMETVTLPYWLGLENLDSGRLNEKDYRQSLRYQYGWENSEAEFLLLMHNV